MALGDGKQPISILCTYGVSGCVACVVVLTRGHNVTTHANLCGYVTVQKTADFYAVINNVSRNATTKTEFVVSSLREFVDEKRTTYQGHTDSHTIRKAANG